MFLHKPCISFKDIDVILNELCGRYIASKNWLKKAKTSAMIQKEMVRIIDPYLSCSDTKIANELKISLELLQNCDKKCKISLIHIRRLKISKELLFWNKSVQLGFFSKRSNSTLSSLRTKNKLSTLFAKEKR